MPKRAGHKGQVGSFWRKPIRRDDHQDKNKIRQLGPIGFGYKQMAVTVSKWNWILSIDKSKKVIESPLQWHRNSDVEQRYFWTGENQELFLLQTFLN